MNGAVFLQVGCLTPGRQTCIFAAKQPELAAPHRLLCPNGINFPEWYLAAAPLCAVACLLAPPPLLCCSMMRAAQNLFAVPHDSPPPPRSTLLKLFIHTSATARPYSDRCMLPSAPLLNRSMMGYGRESCRSRQRWLCDAICWRGGHDNMHSQRQRTKLPIQPPVCAALRLRKHDCVHYGALLGADAVSHTGAWSGGGGYSSGCVWRPVGSAAVLCRRMHVMQGLVGLAFGSTVAVR